MIRSFKAKYFLLVGWQILLLLGLIASKYMTLLTGTTIVLDTVPVDPRELFRGDYVVLRYTISRLNLSQVDNRLTKAQLKPGRTVYVALVPPSGRTQKAWKAVALFGRKPDEEELASGDQLGSYRHNAVFLKGTIVQRQGHTVELKYGIESYFVPEGEGRKLEQSAGKALTVEVTVDSEGRAVIRRMLLYGKPVP